jgi:hypothetical protein
MRRRCGVLDPGMTRYGGRVAMAGFLGGGDAIAAFDPLRDLPSGVHLSFFASAFLFGAPRSHASAKSQ